MFQEEKFTFWCPLQKSEEVLDPTTGEQIMRLGGIASTSDEDSDGEFLDPRGFDIQPLLKSGLVNWHHQAKGQPATIIGEPSKAEIRPEGLYIETDLYPSSQIAHDVWNLANTLEKDSKTRRLGYSIEGKVLKRKSNDKNSPDYKHIVKAVITGVAITHMPKNPKTFANIIKGEIDDDIEEQEEKEVKKDLNTENGAPLKKESVDSDLKVTTFKKAQIIEKILQDTSISIEKAQQIFELIKSIAKMAKKKTITDEDITKAYEALGIEKGCDADGGSDKDLEKDKNQKTEEDSEEEEEKDIKVPEKEDTEEEEAEEERDEDEEEEDQPEAKETNKGMSAEFDEIRKSMLHSNDTNVKYMKALGVLIKAATDKLDAATERENRMMEIIKGQEDTIAELGEKIDAFGSATPGRKSLGSARAVERQFAKGNEPDFTKGNENEFHEGTLSMSRNKKEIVDLLDQATFIKGYDDEFSKACVSFEASNTLPANVINRMKKEFGIEIVK